MKKKNFKFKTLDGVVYEVIFRKPDKRHFGDDCDGICTDPNNENPKIHISPYLTDQSELNTIIHEFAHAFFWNRGKEYEVKKFGDALSRILYNKRKWRKKKK